MKPEISVVIPVYYGEHFIVELHRRLLKVFDNLESTFEIIFVNDASPDDSWNAIKKLANEDNRVVGLNLSRNFGQHPAIMAGLANAKGEYIVVMDCDLQDVPEEIQKLYLKSKEGHKVVVGQRFERQDSRFKRRFSNWFYRVLGYLTGIPQDASIANFGIYHQSVIKAILSMGDYVRYMPAMVKWVGFDYQKVQVLHAPRAEGKSSYNFKSLLKLGLSVITTFSDRPLKLMINMGLIISFASVIVATIYFVLYLMGRIEVLGFTSLIISVWFLAGVIITMLGMVGIYIGKIFDQVKHRPVYIIDETTNDSV
jgi:dolichol-phosphate mannosyltransferase